MSRQGERVCSFLNGVAIVAAVSLALLLVL